MGPLLHSSTWHKFRLVVIDYGPFYPEAIPLRNMKRETIAHELAQVFTQVGIPKQVIMDQDTLFMSEVLQFIWHFLGVQP